MAKELPYFRFTVQEWQNGDISLEAYDMKGVFIDVCGFYWIKDCSITLAILKKRFSNAIEYLESMIDLGVIKHDKKTDEININFLDDQFDLLSDKRKKRVEAGRKGGLSKSSNAKAMLKQNPSYKDKDNDKDNDKDKDKDNDKSIIPSLEEVQSFFDENGYTKYAANMAFNYYHDNDWRDKDNKPVLRWKTKMRNVWFTYQNKKLVHNGKANLPI